MKIVFVDKSSVEYYKKESEFYFSICVPLNGMTFASRLLYVLHVLFKYALIEEEEFSYLRRETFPKLIVACKEL